MSKKNVIFSILAVLLMIVTILTFVSCEKECDHDWGKWETVKKPTCQKEGKKERECEECGETETKKIAKLEHEYGEDGICVNCGNDASSEPGAATTNPTSAPTPVPNPGPVSNHYSHEHSLVWDFNDDYSAGTVEIFCDDGNDTRYEKTVDYMHIETVDATCVEYEKKILHAYVDLDGMEFSTELLISQGTTYASHCYEVVSDDTSHWNGCIYCDSYYGIEAHDYGFTVIEPPTCDQTGVGMYSCYDCAYTKETTMPETALHDYDSAGNCRDCSAVYVDCEHRNVEHYTIDLADYGMCGGEIECIYCYDCDRYISISDYEVVRHILLCDFEMSSGSTLGNMANDSYGVYRCDDCGTEMFDYYARYEGSCRTDHYYTNYCYVNGNIVFEELTCIEKGYDNNTETVEFDLYEYSDCGGYITYLSCEEHGVLSANTPHIYCNSGYATDNDSYVDSLGRKHYVKYIDCPDCDLEYVIDEYYEMSYDCIKYCYTNLICYFDGDEILNISYKDYIDEHDYEVDYELYGDTCEDGVLITYICSNCGDSYSEEYYDHYQYYEKIDLRDYGACGGELWKIYCFCGDEDYVAYEYYVDCDTHYDGHGEEDEYGNWHEYEREWCDVCEFFYEVVSEYTGDYEITSISIYVGSEKLYEQYYYYEYEY